MNKVLTNQEKREILELYLDNEIDEIIAENLQNHFLENEFCQEKILKNLRDSKKSDNFDFAKNKNTANVNLILEEKKVEKFDKNDFLKPVSSSFEAISNLAKRNIENPSFFANNHKFMSLNEIIEKATKLAQNAKNLSELEEVVKNFDGCGLKKMATNTVFKDGNPDSKIMVIGEAPGNHEDLQGIPFCGDSGKLLDAMFASINMKRQSDYYITNVIFWRPPGNRRPTDEELKICRPFVNRHIQLVDPKIIILVGATSMSAILDLKDPITKIRGKVIKHKFDFIKNEVNNFVIFHPSYLMRQSAKKRVAWYDMLALENFLKS